MSDELQLSHTAGTTDVPLLDQTIPDNLDATVARFGDREALVDVQHGIRWTYREFSDRVTGLARALLAAGVATGDRVGIWAPNCAEWTLTQYATAGIGAVLVNINPSYRTHELEYVLKQAGISFLVAASEFKSSNYAQMIEEVRGECPACARSCSSAPGRGTRWSPGRRRSPRSASRRSSRACTPTTRSTSSTPRAPPASPRAPP